MGLIFTLLLSSTLFLMKPLTMLNQAEQIIQKYENDVSKKAPPVLTPQTEKCLNTANIWLEIDLHDLHSPALETLHNELFWNLIKEMGVQGVRLKDLKEGASFRTGLGIDPKWGNGWELFASPLEQRKIVLILDAMGNSTGMCPDFWYALQNQTPYLSFYHLIERRTNPSNFPIWDQ